MSQGLSKQKPRSLDFRKAVLEFSFVKCKMNHANALRLNVSGLGSPVLIKIEASGNLSDCWSAEMCYLFFGFACLLTELFTASSLPICSVHFSEQVGFRVLGHSM